MQYRNNRSSDEGKDQTKRKSPSQSRSRTGSSSYNRSSNRHDSRNRRQSDRGTQELHAAICAKCKKETKVPFKPTGIKPVLCSECFQEQKQRDGTSAPRRFPSRSSSRPNFRSSSSRSTNRFDARERRQSDRGTKELHTVICDKCKKETTVPFKPSGNKPVYCRECFQDEKPKDGSSSINRRLPSRSSIRKPKFHSPSRPISRYDTRVRRQFASGTQELFTVTCSNCNNNTTVPFKPTGSKPVYCRECFKKLKPAEKSSRSRRTSVKSPTRYEGRERRHSERDNLEVFTVICDKCKKETTVPFKPTRGKPVYCKSCFQDPKLKAESPQETSKEQDKVDEVVERFGDRPGPYRASKRMHSTTCRECKKEITIPFKPTADKPIYCQECFVKIAKKK